MDYNFGLMKAIDSAVKNYASKYLLLSIFVVLLPLIFDFLAIELYLLRPIDEINELVIRAMREGFMYFTRLIFCYILFLDLKKYNSKNSWLALISLFSIPFAMVLLILFVAIEKRKNDF